MNSTPNQDPKQATSQNSLPNPFESISKRTTTYMDDIKKLQDAYEGAQKKKAELSKREKEIQKERDDIAGAENKLENDLLSLLRSLHSYLQETITYSNEIYTRGQAEINYRIQAEAAQRALAEAAQSALKDAADRARAEADYRKQAEAAQKELFEQAQQAQTDAAHRIQAELTKTGHIIIDNKRITPKLEPKEEPKPEVAGKVPDTTIINPSKNNDNKETIDLDDLKNADSENKKSKAKAS